MPLLTRMTDELVQQIAKRIVQQFRPERTAMLAVNTILIANWTFL